MAFQILLLLTLIAFSLNHQLEKSDGAVELPAFAFSWLNGNDTFVAGDTATVKVRVLGNYEGGKYEFGFAPNITVNDKTGNSSILTAISSHFHGPTDNWSITFSPIMVGSFNLLIADKHFRVLDSTLEFHVKPGLMYPAAGILWWRGGINEFIAGSKAGVLILPKDAFGNNVSSISEGSRHYNFSLSASTLNGTPATLLNATFKEWNQQGYLCIEFIAATAGSLLLHVEVQNQTLHASPLPFIVHPGKLDVYGCEARLKVETKYFQLLSMMEGLIHQHDQYGNLVSGSYEFDLEVLEKGTNLSMPLADLLFKYIKPGIQLFSFTLYEPGNFTLVISDKGKNILVSNTPYDFTVYTGYCDGVNSLVNGSGLNTSVVGDTAKFSIFLRDAYQYPSPVHLESLKVHIMEVSNSMIIRPTIQIRKTSNGSSYSGRLNYGVIDPMRLASAPLVDPRNNLTEHWDYLASNFDVIYKPQKSGIYEIRVFCGNIALNGGHSFKKEVIPGGVNVSLSGVVKFAPKVQKLAQYEIVVQLMDSYYNPVLLQQSSLKLQIASINKSASTTWKFSDNSDGSYTAMFLANDIGTYEICASYKGENFVPCPFGVNVYDNEYFPEASNDTVSVWEDESVDFNGLENDYFAGGNVSILEFSKPWHGSLLLFGNIFRYTPYKGFYGNDNFSYTISDMNGNLASAFVDLLILCRPPLFVSIPGNLQALEDDISPTFGGYAGFEITYSDWDESISVTLSSISGTILLSPTQMQFWRQGWDQFSVQKEAGELKLVGCVDVVNLALQSIQYLGKQDFYGDDMIRVSTQNKNGRNDIDVPIFVQPVNDPPVINTPSFVIIDGTSDGVSIFKDLASFIHDPDLDNFPGNHSRFLIMLSMEVSGGLLSTNLPAELIGSTEVKMKTSHEWQPLQTFVTISKHFIVKAKGIRFRGAIDECNAILKQLSYHEGEHGAVLTLRVSDLGNHGCYPNCDEMMSAPLFAESVVNLVRFEPMSSLAANLLGSAMVLESIVVISLVLVLLFFLCRCAVVLVREKKREKPQEMELYSSQENVASVERVCS